MVLNKDIISDIKLRLRYCSSRPKISIRSRNRYSQRLIAVLVRLYSNVFLDILIMIIKPIHIRSIRWPRTLARFFSFSLSSSDLSAFS